MISERKEPLTFLVGVEPNQYWWQHVAHIRDKGDSTLREGIKEVKGFAIPDDSEMGIPKQATNEPSMNEQYPKMEH